MDSHEVLSLYESVADITRQMLDAARVGNWEQLAELESRCSTQVAMIKDGEPSAAMTGVVRERKVKIIRKILEDDRQIRDITEPWMARLTTIMNNASNDRNAAQTNPTS
ncbi:flagellar synthesis protein [Noviherbaspirillum denitrificans]|uniref:Flagellar protein FliT n=2 Tax=Noviherbaspirillum denitrificans TaxID=1968433 RepID=A0A254TK09_9BURK|nr:flagellar synthesis protein [Noviherbaspirillum denitrificans]